jgi:hypothetical protein
MFNKSASASLLLDIFGFAVAIGSLIFLISDIDGNYSLAHFLRAIRLWLILGSDQLSFKAVFGLHITIAFLSFATPFKLGELLRVSELCRLLRNDVRGLFVVWLDRLFDVAVILSLLTIFTLPRSSYRPALFVIASLSGFLVFSILLVMLLPGAASAFMRALLQSSSKRSLMVLRMAVRLRSVMLRVPKFDGQTLSLLSIVTFTIWGLELLSILLLLIALPVDSSNSIANKAVEILNYTLIAQSGARTPLVAFYRLTCVMTLALMVSAGVYSYARYRMNTFSRNFIGRGYKHRCLFEFAGLQKKGRIR